MTAICVTGMHRSGTSMVMRALNLAGLHIGARSELMLASDESPDGYWEHAGFVEVNEQLLNSAGAGWDFPPPAAYDWTDVPETIEWRAKSLVDELATEGLWGFKDPRASLTIGFWRAVVPGLRTVLCVRNPLEVALSLQRRGSFSYSLGLTLWRVYNERLLAAVPSDERIVTHYDAYTHEAERELSRVGSWAGLPPAAGVGATASSEIDFRRHHHRFTLDTLREVGVAGEIVDLYVDLCEQAEWTQPNSPRPAPVTAAPKARDQRPLIDLPAIRLELALQDLGAAEAARPAADDAPATLEQRPTASEAGPQLDDLQRELTDLREQVTALTEIVVSREAELQVALEDLPVDDDKLRRVEYLRLVGRVRALVHRVVPAGRAVVVESGGDDDLLQFAARPASHLALNRQGKHPGHNPSGSRAAIAYVEAARGRGAEYLVLPAPSAWWLEHYTKFAAHLDRRYRLIADVEGTAKVWGLSTPSAWRAVDDFIAEFVMTTGRAPNVLDWSTGIEFANRFDDCRVFAPIDDSATLPYLDSTVDVVAIATDEPAVLREARRVSTAAIFVVDPVNGDVSVETVDAAAGGARDLDVAVVVASLSASAPDPLQLGVLRDSLPGAWAGDLLVLAERTERVAAAANVRLQRTGNLHATTLAEVAAWTSATFVAIVDSDVVPLAGWLPALTVALAGEDVGVVTGMVLDCDTSIVAAGAVMDHGDVVAVGAHDFAVDAPRYRHVRDTDVAIPGVLAIRRSVLAQFVEANPASDSLVDLCLAVRSAGKRVVYTPEACAVRYALDEAR